MQIATGEGKSTTAAITALIKALQCYKVVVTSSLVLAQRDATEWMSFFAMFGLTSGHNIDKNYQKDVIILIVYGYANNFQADILWYLLRLFF